MASLELDICTDHNTDDVNDIVSSPYLLDSLVSQTNINGNNSRSRAPWLHLKTILADFGSTSCFEKDDFLK